MFLCGHLTSPTQEMVLKGRECGQSRDSTDHKSYFKIHLITKQTKDSGAELAPPPVKVLADSLNLTAGGRREVTPANCSLTPTHALWMCSGI